MGFSLSNFVKRAANDINPFDGPKQAPRPATTAPQQQAPAPAPHQNPLQHAFGNIGHAVGNVEHAGGNVVHAGANVGHAATTLGTGAVQFVPQFAENYANTFANLGRKAAGAPNATIQQNMGGNRLLNNTLKFSGATGKNKQLVGDVAQVGLSALPGVGKGANLAVKAATGAGVGAGFNAASTFGQGGNLKQVGQSAALGGTIGAALPIAGRAVKVAAPKVGNLAKDVATMKPQRNVSDQQLAAANRVSMTRNGFPDSTKPGDVQAYRQVQQKLGVDANNHKAVDDLIGARMTHQNRTPVQNILRGHQPLSLDSAGKGLVSEDGSVIPTVKKLAGKSQPKEVVPTPEPNRSSSSEPTISQPKTAPAPTTKLVPQEAPVAQPTTSLVAKPATVGESVALPQDTPKVVPNALSAKTDKQNISPEVAAQVSGEHTVRNTQQLADTSAAAVDKLPTNTAIEQAHSLIAQPLGHVNDEQTGFIAKTIEKADTEAAKARAAGNTVEADRLTREAAALHDGLSEHATARGQSQQALTLLYKQSPQGMLYGALRDLGKAGIKDTPELRAKLQPLVDAVKTATSKAEKTDAIANFHQAVSKVMPQHLSDKVIGIWKAGLLSGVKTQQGNAISNATFGALKKVSDVPATAVDKLMSVFTGKRTKTLSGTGIASGTKEGAINAKYTMKTGIDRRGAGDKYEQHAEIDFKNPVLNKTLGTAVRTVFRGMNAADQPFWYAAFKNSMYDQAKAEAINAKVPYGQRKAFMENLVKNPTDKMANTALSEANKSTLNYDTLASKAVQAVHTGIDKVQSLNGRPVPPQARAAAHAAMNVLAPFVRVPTAFLSRTIDFTPLGPIKEAVHQVFTKQFDQRALSQAVGEGMTGTGAIALGIALTQNKMLSGDFPKNDQKEQQRWKAEGITPNSVKLGGKWVSLNYLGPLGLLFNAGNKIETAKGQGASQQTSQALVGFGTGLMGQSFLQGFSGFSDAINDPARNAKSFVNSQASSVVPAIVNDAANATDKFQRQADTPGQSIKNRIPGLRETNPVKQDVYGNPLKQAAGPLGTINGLKPSNSLTGTSPAIAEVNRLHSVDPNNNDLQVTPTPVGKTVSMPAAKKGDKPTTVNLNDKQRYDLQKAVGQTTQDNWNKLIKTPEYQAMTDTEKAKKLTAMRQDATELATRKYVVDNNLGTYDKPASKSAAALAGGDMSKYTSASDGTSSSTDLYKSPDAEYKAIQDKFNKQAKAGFNSPAQKISMQNELAKAQVGAKYDKSIRDAYNLSNADLYNYVSNDPNGKAIADKVLAYSQDLKDAGITATAKFKTKYGVVTLGNSSTGSGKSSGGSSRKTSNSKFAASLKANNSADSSNQKALLALVKNAKVHGPSGSSSRLKVAGVTLKKQSVKPTNRKKAQVA